MNIHFRIYIKQNFFTDKNFCIRSFLPSKYWFTKVNGDFISFMFHCYKNVVTKIFICVFIETRFITISVIVVFRNKKTSQYIFSLKKTFVETNLRFKIKKWDYNSMQNKYKRMFYNHLLHYIYIFFLF